ncbi:hypothetical protein HLB32_17315, partial [Streptomyces cacaoi]|nr:hypothetical protein [Streptomyces cacaoi]
MPEQGRPGAAGETAGRAAREARLGSFLHALRAAMVSRLLALMPDSTSLVPRQWS